MAPTVSIVIPAFNEAARIGMTISRIQRFLEGFPFPHELIIVDDGSTDETPRIVERSGIPTLRLLRNESNHGKGYAVRQGVLASRGDFVLFTDADLSAPIEEIEKLMAVALKEDADVVIGSRAVDRSMIAVRQSRMRESGGVAFNLVVRTLLGLRLRDTQCGFKLFTRSSADRVFRKQTISGFGFDPEVLFLASKGNLTIREVPVRWSHSQGSKIRFLRDGVRMFFVVHRIRSVNFPAVARQVHHRSGGHRG
jgi:glycosyltransferase involved in cell wall biosynthesis